jgi:hypothetical protein
MNHKQYIAIALILSAFGSTVFPLGMSSAYGEGETAKPADTVSAEVGKPLQAAQELYKQKKYPEALDALNEASALKKTPYEAYVIDRTRAAVATASGDDKLKLESYQAVVASGRLAADEQLKFVQAISRLYYEKADYAQAIAWTERFLKEGGVDPQAHALLAQSYYLSNDFPHAAKELQIDLDAAEKAGAPPTDKQLRILISIATKQNDSAGYVRALEKFVTYYPKKEYWADLIYRLQTRPDFSPHLLLDVYRLKFSLGLLSKPAEYVDMAEMSILAGFPAEAKKVMEAGYKSGVLGAGGDAEKQKSVLNSATKKSADDLKAIAQTEADVRKNKDGSGLINLGYAFITMNQFDKGLAMMEQGVKAPGIKRAEEAKLHLATAYALAGRTQEAIAAFKTVQGNDGSADLAHYWVLQLTHPMP